MPSQPRSIWSAIHCFGLVLITSCTSSSEPLPAGNAEQLGYIDVLFIGNSLTYTNDLPEAVAALSRSMQDSVVIRAAMVAAPNYNLEDHWFNGTALQAIKVGDWEYVVLQQGPSSLEANRQQLIRSTQQFSELIASGGATPALFAAWPQENRFMDFARAMESYALAADAVNGRLFPVAAAWHIVLTQHPEIRLYSDGLHPTTTGTYLTAAVIYGAIYNTSVTALPNEITSARGRFAVEPHLGAVLRAAADSANRAYRLLH